MARAVTLLQLRTDIQTKGDFGGATVRHTPTQLTRYINQSIQSFRERISDGGSQHYLRSSSGTLGVGPTDPYPFYQLDLSGLSPSLVRTYGIDVTIDNEVVSLEHVPFEQRSKYGSRQSGRPMAWSHFRTDQVAIMPPSSSAHAYVVWYLPVLADLSADGDTFDGVAGWEEFIVWDVVCQLIARDQFPQAYQIAEQRRQEVWQNVIRGATKVTQAGGAHTGRDSFGTKLTHFLGSRHQPVAAAGGPVTPTQDSVTVGHLAHFAGPAVIGVPSGTTDPIHWHVHSLTSYQPVFTLLARGMVPPPGSSSNLFLRDDGTWASAAGASSSQGASGAIQFQAGGGNFGNASGFAIIGSHPSLIARLQGSLRVTGGQIEVGSGTVRMSASGIDAGNGSIVNVATLVGQDVSVRGLLVSSGIPNSQLTPMASGTVKAQLAADSIPKDVPIATLFAHYPTFTSLVHGAVPASGGGTTNFLRADGTWDVPPGGGTPGGTYDASGNTAPGGSIQYINASGAFGGTRQNRVRIMENTLGEGVALAFGGFSPTGITSGVSVSDNFQVAGHSASGGALAFLNWREAGQAGAGFSGAVAFFGNGSNSGRGIHANVYRTASGGFHLWQMGGSSGLPHMRLEPTGLDASQLHLAAKGLTVTNGITNANLASMASGTVKGQLGPDGTPNDVAVATLHAFAPTFTATNPGTVPESGGGTTNYLRADGVWDAPPGAAGNPGQPDQSVQFRSSDGTFYGASGIKITGSGGAAVLEFGGAGAPSAVAGGGLGRVRGFGDLSFFGTTPSYVNLRLIQLQATGAAYSPTGPVIDIGTDSTNRLAQLWSRVGTGGSHTWSVGGSGSHARLTQSGMDLLPFHLAAKGLTVTEGVTNSNLATMSTGTVKGSLAGGTPADVPFATFMAFAPTFTDVRMGVVPASGGGTTNYLRADGTWGAPPGTAAAPGAAIGAIQYNNGVGGFNGASGVNIVASGQALGIGVPSFLPAFGDVRVASGFNITANLPSGIAGVAARQSVLDWSGGGASGVLKVGGASGVMGTNRGEVATGGAFEWLIGGQTGAKLSGTALDVSRFHITAKSLDVPSINGLPADANQLKRGTNPAGGSGIPSGLSLYVPRGAGSGANRYIIPTGALYAPSGNAPWPIVLSPTGARGGQVIRIERLDTTGIAVDIKTPTGTILHSMPSGTKSVADFVLTKPSGAVFELGGAGDLF